MSPDLTISVLHYNNVDLTKECLTALDGQQMPCTFEKQIVDNGSSIRLKPDFCKDWKITRYEVNHGHINGQNRCFRGANGTWVLFVANDVRVLPGCLQQLWRSKNPCGIVQPVLYTIAGRLDNGGLRWKWPGYGLSKRDQWDIPPDAFTASCYLMPKKIWEELQGFDECLRTSHEDIEFSLRALKAGYAIRTASCATAIHQGNATLKYQPSHNRWTFHLDRRTVIMKHYHGLNRLVRLAMVDLLDTIPRL